MKQEDLLKCPLLQGLDALHRAELLGLINSSSLKEKIEQCLSQHGAAEPEGQKVTAGWKPADFPKDVQSWDTDTPVWRRSSKE